jgi:type VI protein secretion system component Hcp
MFEANARGASLNSSIQGSTGRGGPQKTKRILRGLAVALMAALCLGNASQAWAQTTAVLKVTASGLGCTALSSDSFNILSWSWGTTDSVGSKTAATSDLNVSKTLDGCSAALFGAVSSGKQLTTVTLIQTDPASSDTVTVTLSGSTVTSWQISGSAGGGKPFESVSFSFTKVCVAESLSGTSFCSSKP